ncbi:M50 family metallopeptidase [soil metagenome]
MMGMRRIQEQQARWILAASVVVTALLYVVPGGRILAYPLVLLSTFVHEMAHGLTAIVVGGTFVDLQVFGDASGVAVTATDGGALDRAAVAAGGLIGPALAAAIGFTMARRPQTSRIALIIGSLLVAIGTVLWVRSLIGWLVALGLIGTSLGIALGLRQAQWSQLWLVLLSVQLGLSVFSRSEYLFAEGATTGAGRGLSDSAAIAAALFGPYWLWGALCGLVSVAVLAYGLLLFVYPPSGRQHA